MSQNINSEHQKSTSLYEH